MDLILSSFIALLLRQGTSCMSAL